MTAAMRAQLAILCQASPPQRQQPEGGAYAIATECVACSDRKHAVPWRCKAGQVVSPDGKSIVDRRTDGGWCSGCFLSARRLRLCPRIKFIRLVPGLAEALKHASRRVKEQRSRQGVACCVCTCGPCTRMRAVAKPTRRVRTKGPCVNIATGGA